MSLLSALYLFGIAAIGLPIAFHMLRRSPRGLVPFGSTMFLRPSPPTVTKRSRLEHWPLLLLRAMAIVLLAFAFARPFLRAESTASESAAAGRRIAVLVDTSASMRRDGLWDDVKSELDEMLDGVKPNDEVALYAFDHHTRPLLRFDEWADLDPPVRTQVARQRLAELEPGWGGSDLGNALVTAVEAVVSQGEDRRGWERSVVVVGDVQAGSRLERLSDSHWPDGVRLEVRRLEPARTTNAGVQIVAERTVGDPSRPRPRVVRVRVSNAGDSANERFRLRWVDPEDDPEVEENPSAKPSESVEVHAPPGTSRTLRAPLRPEGLVDGVLEIVGDDHPFDNRVAVPETEPERVRMLYLGADAADDRESPRYFLERAFPPTAERRVEVLVQDPGTPPNPAMLGDVRFVVATDGLPGKHPEALRAFAERGGRVLVAPRSVAAAEGLGELLDVPGLAVEEADVDGYTMLSAIDFEHPLFAPFSEARFADFSTSHVWHHRTLGDGLPEEARVLAQFEDGSPMFVERRLGEGLVWVWTTGWHPSDGQFALSTKFVPLMNAMLDASRGRRLEVGRVVVGDAIPLPSSEGVRAVHTPDGARIAVAREATSFGETTEPGVYEVVVDGEVRRIGVAIDPRESETAPLPAERLETLGVRFTASETTRAAEAVLERQRLRRELENEQKTWRWILLAVLAVVVAETLLGGRLARRSREVEAST